MYGELQAQLAQELDRLGIDPDKTPAAAPTGSANAVFDLHAALIDPDGAGGAPPQGIELRWTERLIGDYDQNGEVNGADLTPLAQHFRQTVLYDAPALHGGFASWPAGDPDGAGALNWRKARIDGDGNGEINLAEVTVIAKHFRQQLSGYRVYRKAPGEPQFSRLPSLQDPGSLFTMAHPAAQSGQPVRYALTDAEATADGLGEGVYQFYVAAFDTASGQEGPPSSALAIDTATGTTAQPPVARLTVTPDFGGQPVVVTLDAAGSADPDGTIAEYVWDLDGDGTPDYRSTDPQPPFESSTPNLIRHIAPGTQPSRLTAKYVQGSAGYYYPSVQVIDDAGLASSPASARLGVSGWTYEVLNKSFADYELPFYPHAVTIDPQTGEVCVAGWCSAEHNPHVEEGLYFARRKSAGNWQIEQADVPPIPGVKLHIILHEVFWDAQNQPVLLMARYIPFPRGQVWTARRAANGNWSVEMLWDTAMPSTRGGSGTGSHTYLGPGRFACLLSDHGTDKPLYGHPNNFNYGKFYLVLFENDEWTISEAGFDTSQAIEVPGRLYAGIDGEIYALMGCTGVYSQGLWRTRWVEGEGFVEPTRLDSGQLQFAPQSNPVGAMQALDGTLYCLHEDPNFYPVFALINGPQITLLDPDRLVPSYTQSNLHLIDGGAAFFGRPYKPPFTNGRLYYRRLENGSWLNEDLMPLQDEGTLTPYNGPFTVGGRGDVWMVASRMFDPTTLPPEQQEDFQDHFALARRVDPRMGD